MIHKNNIGLPSGSEWFVFILFCDVSCCFTFSLLFWFSLCCPSWLSGHGQDLISLSLEPSGTHLYVPDLFVYLNGTLIMAVSDTGWLHLNPSCSMHWRCWCIQIQSTSSSVEYSAEWLQMLQFCFTHFFYAVSCFEFPTILM